MNKVNEFRVKSASSARGGFNVQGIDYTHANVNFAPTGRFQQGKLVYDRGRTTVFPLSSRDWYVVHMTIMLLSPISLLTLGGLLSYAPFLPLLGGSCSDTPGTSGVDVCGPSFATTSHIINNQQAC